MTAWDSFKDLWKTPAINMSGVDTFDYASALAQAKTTLKTTKAKLVTSIDQEIKKGKDEYAKENGLINYGINNTYTDSNGKEYLVDIDKGQLQLKTKEYELVSSTKLSSPVFDSTDQADYNNRYVSLDAPYNNNDARDVAFFRIIDIKKQNVTTVSTNPSNVIFPNYEGWAAPGISKNKFRQMIITQTSVPSQERMQIVETSETFNLLFYGKKPEVLSIGGILKNTADNPWSTNMVFIWDELMRGTKLAENGWIFEIFIDNELFRGYPFGFTRSKIAPSEYIVSFNFSLIITDRISLRSDDIKFDNSVTLISPIQSTNLTNNTTTNSVLTSNDPMKRPGA